MRARLIGVLVLLVGVIVPATRAHALLDHAEPKVGSTVPEAPREIRLWFSASLEPAFSTAEVRDKEHRRVDLKDAHLDRTDRAVLIVSVPALAPGTYTVNWRAVSTDTHRTEGHFMFTVRPRR